MVFKITKWVLFVFLFFSKWFYNHAYSQNLVCVNSTTLLTDSQELHDYKYPYFRINKTVNAAGKETGIIIYFQDFYENLLFDIDTLNFELFSFEKHISKIIKVPVGKKFKDHKLQPKHQLNSFYVVENKLYLLVSNTIYEYEISKSKVCGFRKSYKMDKIGFDWLSMIDKQSGILCKSLIESNEGIEFLKFNIKNNKIVFSDTLIVKFDGMNYLLSENSFISTDGDFIIMGNATSSKIVFIDKNKLEIKNSFYHAKSTLSSNNNNTSSYSDKFNLLNSIYSDSSTYHYQTCYFSDSVIYRSRTKRVGKHPHLLDIYKMTNKGWDSVETLCEGLYNFKRFRDTSEIYGLMHFDPMSSVNSRIAANGSLFAIGLSFDLTKDLTKNKNTFYKFPISELRNKGKTAFENKTYQFNIYEYKLVH
jgi:hypothetical protein